MPMGELPGRISTFFGGGDSDVPQDERMYGMNPRRAYWTNALQDLASISSTHGGATGQMSNRAMQGNAAQMAYQQKVKQAAVQKQYMEQMSAAAVVNSWKTRDASTPAMKNAAAMGLIPGTPEYSAYINKATTHPLVDMGDKSQGKYIDSLLKNLPKVQGDAQDAATEIGRVDAMEGLIKNLGRTGAGKEMMVNVKSFATQMGMGWLPDFVDRMAQKAGQEKIFTGELGAQELFRALSSEDILAEAKKLYPVSNTDISFLREAQATLGMNDPNAMMALLGRRRQQSQTRMDTYNWYRDALKQFDSVPPLPEIKAYDTRGLGAPKARQSTLTPAQEERYQYLLKKAKENGIDLGQ